MANLNKLHSKKTRANELAQIAEKASDIFKDKIFADRHLLAFKFSRVFNILFSAISIGLGAYGAMSLPYPIFIKLPVAILLLFALEAIKNYSIGETAREKLSESKISIWAVVALLLSVASIAVSFSGAQSLADSKKTEIFGSSELKLADLLDSAKIEQLKQLGILDSTTKSYFNSVSWKGKISQKNAVVYNLMIESGNKAKESYKAQSERIKSDFAGNHMEKAQSLSERIKIALLSVCIANEFFIIILAVFCSYYLFRAHSDGGFFEENYTLSNSALQSLSSFMRLSNGNEFELLNSQPQQLSQDSQASTQIGFKADLKNDSKPYASNTQVDFKVALKSRKDSDYRAKYPKLCEDLNRLAEGNLKATTAELASKHSVSADTIYRIKKAIFV